MFYRRPRRLKVLAVSAEALATLLTIDPEELGYAETLTVKGVPPDCEVAGVEVDEATMAIRLILWHASFPPLMDGQRPPHVHGTMLMGRWPVPDKVTGQWPTREDIAVLAAAPTPPSSPLDKLMGAGVNLIPWR